MYLNFNFNLSIAGDGDEKNNLLNLAKELKVDDKINFLGFVDNINSFLENIDIVECFLFQKTISARAELP